MTAIAWTRHIFVIYFNICDIQYGIIEKYDFLAKKLSFLASFCFHFGNFTRNSQIYSKQSFLLVTIITAKPTQMHKKGQ